MNSIKIYFDDNFNLTSIDDSEVTLIQGDVESKAIDLYFELEEGKTVLDYSCRVSFERPDLSESGELYATPFDDYYRIVLPAWVTEQFGTVNLTARLKEGSIVAGYGLATITVEEGVMPSEENITLSQAQYQALLDVIDDLSARVTALEGEIQ